MKKIITPLLAFALFALFTVGATAQEEMWEVTFSNITKGQPLAPVLLVTHKAGFELFTPGKRAPIALATLAETGNPTDMAARVMNKKKVLEVVTGVAPPTMPGKSVTLTIMGNDQELFSMAAMLGATNDCFAGGRDMKLEDGAVYYVPGWDAGSEENTEAIGDVGFLGGGNGRRTANAEGRVFLHNGIHGIADMDPAIYDWRNPVVMISIKKVN